MNDFEFDKQHIWHPYSAVQTGLPCYKVVAAKGVKLTLEDPSLDTPQFEVIDAMASWWSVIHGYNHPELNRVAFEQIDTFSHVMFGGLTHQAAIDLCKTLVAITPPALSKVFLSDSGSVSVDVAMKMAIQYWQAKNKNQKSRFMALSGAYHGDTLGAMSVCDPVTSMHHLFADNLTENIFIDRPKCLFNEAVTEQHIENARRTLQAHHHTLAAVIVEPIVQGAGGMYFYAADYLKALRELCDEYDVLLIADEIATGFGRTGKLFACEHAAISPDIMCLGKTMTGGYITLAATLCSDKVAQGIADSEAGVFMHGPTFMGNPLACRIAHRSIELLLEQDWQQTIKSLETRFRQYLDQYKHELNGEFSDQQIRVLGGIAVIEANHAIDMAKVRQLIPELGVWLRPFGKLVYTMPPYCISDDEIEKIVRAMIRIVNEC